MTSKYWLAAIGVMAAMGVSQARAQPRPACDRACLDIGLDRYLAALAKHDPRAAPLSPGFRGTENGMEIKPGEGLWTSAQGLGALQRRYFDPETAEAAYYGLIEEAGGPALVTLRLKFDGRRISQAEAIVARKGERLFDLDGILRNPPADPAAAPPQPGSRAAIRAAVDGYFDALQAHDGAAVAHTAGCPRLESGSGGRAETGVVARDCAQGFEQLLQISAVAHRRYAVIDTRSGAAVITAMFLRPPGAKMPDGQPWKRNLFMDVVTVTDTGQISGVYGAMHYLAPADPETSGWPDGG